MARTWLFILIPLAYVIGSIPFGLLVGKSRGIDPRKGGSGNIGATNVGRLLGRRFFFVVFFLDLLKSMLPMLLASYLAHKIPGGLDDWRIYLIWLLVGFAAVIGHMFSLFIGFKGGKGVATSCGVMMGLFPFFTWPGFVAIATFIVVLYFWRYVSLGSMLGSSAFPIAYVLIAGWLGWPVFKSQLPLLIFAIVMPTLIIYKHRGNIARLRAGTENRIGSKPKPSVDQPVNV